jgi:hypothetical protein
MYTERIYVFFTIIINSSLIILIWQLINHDSKEGEIAWLPLVLWISIPVCFWSFSNNMHENTMGIFVLLSVLFYLKAVNANSTIFLIFSGLFIFLATFSKGIPGFFPIVLPIIYWASIQQIKLKTVIFQTFLLIAIPVSIYALLICFPEARLSLSNYLIKRVLHRIEDNPTVDSQFYILGRLFLELLIPVSITLIIYFVFRRKLFFDKAKISFAVFFILVGFSGALPLLLTKVQKGFYFVPSLPFFAIGFALLISNPVHEWSVKQLNSVNKKWIMRTVGKKELNKISNNYISCCGTVMGKFNNILNYCKEMKNHIEKFPYKRSLHSILWGRKNLSYDQGIQNYLVYSGILKNIGFYNNQNGNVATLHTSKLLKFNAKNRLVNFKEEEYSVVHQYDRFNEYFENFVKEIKDL